MDWTTSDTFNGQCRLLVKRVLTSCCGFVKSISLDWRCLFQKNLSSAYTIQFDQHNKFIVQSLQQVLPFPKMPSVRLSLSFPIVAAAVALNPTGRRTGNFPHVNVTWQAPTSVPLQGGVGYATKYSGLSVKCRSWSHGIYHDPSSGLRTRGQ